MEQYANDRGPGQGVRWVKPPWSWNTSSFWTFNEDANLPAFLRVTAGTAIARLSHRNSVRLFVCPSHGWISQKRCKLGLPNIHRQLPGRL